MDHEAQQAAEDYEQSASSMPYQEPLTLVVL
jgi:hypothetical protein